MTHDYTVLELDKILDRLAGETAGGDAADMARALRPSVHIDEVRYLLQETDDACRLMAGFGAPSFGQLHNVDNILARASAGACLTAAELLTLADTLHSIRAVADWRAHCAEVQTVLDERFFALSPNKYLEEKIVTTFPTPDTVADNASPLLHDIRRKMRAAGDRVRGQLDKILHGATTKKYLQETIITMRGGRYVVPVKAEHRGSIAGLVHDTSATGATVFIEPLSVVEANNELRLLESREAAEIERILFALSEEVSGFADGITADYRILVELNVIFAKARLAYAMKGSCPKVVDDGHLILHSARHPLIDPKTVVPIDVELGGEFDTLVITGPNTGGKTVTLKTIGLLTLMTMCGLLPTVRDGSQVSVFKHILVDIGDEQSIEQSLSTFSAHMTNLIRILKEANDHSLVLMDEVGAGTDPIEGAALAVAIIEKLRVLGAKVAATTHYAELKAFAIETDGVQNGSSEFDVENLRPTYRLIIGTPGRSNAFAITERLGLDTDVIAAAKKKVSADDRHLETVVSALEARRADLENRLAAAKDAAARAAMTADETKKRLQSLEKAREQALEDAKNEGARLLEKARTEAQNLLDEIAVLRRQKARGAGAIADGAGKLKAHLKRIDDTLDPVIEKQNDHYTLPRPLQVGDAVRLADIDKEAAVLAIDGDTAEVQIGVIRTRTPLSNLRLIVQEKSQKTAKKPTRGGVSTLADRMTRSAATDLDLRGMTVEEAILEIDRFLDNAVLAGLERVTLIHGKGTGALRTGVQSHLRSHRQVKAYRLGVYGEGETGVTVVELK